MANTWSVDKGLVRLDGLHLVGLVDADVEVTWQGRHGEVRRVGIIRSAEQRMEADAGGEHVRMVGHRAEHGPRADAVADATHRAVARGRLRAQVSEQPDTSSSTWSSVVPKSMFIMRWRSGLSGFAGPLP